MTLRRTAPLVLALLACQADLDRRPLRAVDYAVFDPTNSLIPLPNDLALQSVATMPNGAQKELLGQFAAAGGFPNDQEMPITIQLTRATVNEAAGGEIVYSAPELDLESVNGETVALIEISSTGSVTPVAFEASYAKNPDGLRGTLTLRRPVTNGTRRWTAGARYVVALRGGPDGVKVVGGSADGLQAQPTFFIVREAALKNLDLTNPENQTLLPGTREAKAAAGAQLDALRQAYTQPLQLVDQVGGIPAEEVAVLATFQIAPSVGVAVAVDAGSGIVPLPIDLLRNPDADGKPGTVVNNPAFGPAAAGLATLDGFSTTATILAQTTGVIDASTVTPATVKLFKLDGEGGATPVAALGAANPPQVVVQPPVLNQSCPAGSCSTVIGIQPAVPVDLGGGNAVFLPPLEEGTDYAVVITKGVKDAAGQPLVKSTFAKILLDVQSPVVVNGKSALSGVSDDTAKQIAMMKEKLAPALAEVEASDVVMAYTFRTQSIAGTSVQLSASVYDAAVNPGIVATAPAADPTLGAPFMHTTIMSLDAIDPATGALKPSPATWSPVQLDALVAVPPAAALTEACPHDPALKCAPLVVFHHGLNGGRWQAAALAEALLPAGFALAAIDAPYHGQRAFCSQNSDCVVEDGGDGVCTPDPARATQGDEVPPGVCTTGTLRFDLARKTTVASGNYFISSNFFRIRDAIRQDLIDQAALVLALARPPTMPLPQGVANPFAEALAANGIGIHPGKVYYVGQSLGGIIGTNVLATNPRFSRGVLNVAGGTLVDVFTNGDAFAAAVDELFLGLGIDRSQIPTNPDVAAQYLKTLNVAKWILDPADPINFAKHLVAEPLPNLLANPDGSVPQEAKDVFGQAAYGDNVVENPFNMLLYENAGIDWTMYLGAGGTAASHGFLSASTDAQADVVDWLSNLTYPGAQVILP